MATIVTRSGKGSPLENSELDANFTNLNNDKQEVLAEGSFTDGDKTKLDGIESGATADQTAQEIATAIDADATAEATLKSALGLGTAAYTASTDYATAAQGALADSALQSIPDNYVLNTGDAITGNLSFGDNDKAIFGAGSDLQIYHDGSNSYIKDAGTGHLQVWANDLRMSNAAGTKSFLYANDGGATVINYDGSAKLATTSTGIDVTGTVIADGLTVGTSSTIKAITVNDTFPFFCYRSDLTANTSGYAFNITSAGDLALKPRNDDGSAISSGFMSLAHNGDISFYEDTGTTAKFFWDASAESLGIGTDVVGNKLDVRNSSTGAVPTTEALSATSTAVAITNPNNSGVYSGLSLECRTSGASRWLIYNEWQGTYVGDLVFRGRNGGTSSAERMRIDSSGNVLVGKTSADLDIVGCEVRGSLGYLSSTRDGGHPLDLNRQTSDGAIAQFRKNGTTVGSIGVSSGSAYIDGGSGVSGVQFGVGDIRPRYNGALVDGSAADLGHPSNRWQNLYLSGNLSDGTNSVSVADLASGGGAGAVKAWVNFNGQGTPAIRQSGNVSSITDNGTGLYTINFTTAMPDADYCFSGGGWRNSTGAAAPFITTPNGTTSPFSTTSLSIMTSLDNSNEFDMAAVTVAIHR